MLLNNISLDKVCESGQSFRWKKIANGHYLVPYKRGACEVFQENETNARILWFFGENEDFYKYFDEARDYSVINDEIICDYPFLKEALVYSEGIRILNQDPIEMIITFIISANNNIKRIANTVGQICDNYGEVLSCDELGDINLFPSLDRLLEISEEEFKSYGAGYRAPYLKNTVNQLYYEEEYELWQHLEDEELLIKLKSLMGVGPKVASCIALFAYSRFEMFPVDTWIKKAIEDTFNFEADSAKKVSDRVSVEFTRNRGIIQQYLFYYYRNRS